MVASEVGRKKFLLIGAVVISLVKIKPMES